VLFVFYTEKSSINLKSIKAKNIIEITNNGTLSIYRIQKVSKQDEFMGFTN